MTNRELSQLYYLKQEIEMKRRKIHELETIAEDTASKIIGTPHPLGINDKIGTTAAEIAYIKAILSLNVQEYYYQYNRLLRYIETIDDSLVRQIMTYRYIDLMTWNDVADTIGGGNTEDSVKKKVYRFLESS